MALRLAGVPLNTKGHLLCVCLQWCCCSISANPAQALCKLISWEQCWCLASLGYVTLWIQWPLTAFCVCDIGQFWLFIWHGGGSRQSADLVCYLACCHNMLLYRTDFLFAASVLLLVQRGKSKEDLVISLKDLIENLYLIVAGSDVVICVHAFCPCENRCTGFLWTVSKLIMTLAVVMSKECAGVNCQVSKVVLNTSWYVDCSSVYRFFRKLWVLGVLVWCC